MFARKKMLATLLAFSLLWAACGSDSSSDSTPTGPVPTEADVLSVLTSLANGFAGLDLAQFFSGEEQVVEGFEGQGSLVITVSSWTFAQYSPDGLVTMDGVLTLTGLTPILISGDLTLSGDPQGTVGVNMTVDISAGVENLALGGTVKFNGVEFDVAEVLANAPPVDAAPADSTAAESTQE